MSGKGRLLESPESSEEQGADLDVKSSGEAGQDEAEKSPVKRMRGRPRKFPKQPVKESTEPKRPRGRPKGSPNRDQKPTPEPQETRPKGRPKGTFGKEKQLILEGKTRGRGRPSKASKRKATAATASSPKKGSPEKKIVASPRKPTGRSPGRPRKIQIEEEEKSEDSPEEDEVSEDDADQEEES